VDEKKEEKRFKQRLGKAIKCICNKKIVYLQRRENGELTDQTIH
jgi:hypothetical protein